MARYKTSGTASIHLRAEFEDDGGELFDQAAMALETVHRRVPAISGHYDLEIEECELARGQESKSPTLGEIIKEKAARARAWVMGD